MKHKSFGSSGRVLFKAVGTAVGFTAVIVLLMLWLAGTFHPKVGSAPPEGASTALSAGTRLEVVRRIRMPVVESAVGTIRAVHQTAVASKLLARVEAVNVTAGQTVARDEVLIKLDDDDLAARLRQAQSAVAAAGAARDQARIEHDRIQGLIEKQAAPPIEYDRAVTALKTAEAELARARQAEREAATILEYATIRSPIDGTIIDKLVEEGDTVTPGQTLLTLYDPTRMQLVASVRESLAQRMRVGEPIQVRIDALEKTCIGQVSEIVPEAEAATRSFAVKVTGPCPPNVYSGMFGRLLIPLEEQELLVVPAAAVRRIGQLTVVEVADGTVLRRRAVQLGREIGDDIQVLSGLREGERVVLSAANGAGGSAGDV